MGGFDIFTSTLSEDGFWSPPENIGYPINTTDDDVFYVPTKDEKHAYYSSAKLSGYGDMDIYKLTIISKKKMVAILKGIIFDDLSYKPLEAKIEITDVEKNMVIASFLSDATTGDYYVSLPTGKKYKMKVTADRYISHEETFEVPETIESPEINKAIILQKVQAVAKDKLMFDNKEITVGERIVLNNVLFDFDKSDLRSESKVELDKWVLFLKENPTLKVEISGHTDSRGTSAYNNKLSEDRAKIVRQYFIENGIKESAMTYKGYGFTQPIATNLTDEGRQKNRRTEIKITSKY
jgi:outer membrane protein OmpA-like peptidoglycan-associated protein